ncbi:MAG TPA: carboxypeptidase-like regulatory domain-containing protein [Flavitalea sp.]|nr:carboxypeptidase-like regulatory domain-containing protein [Flavitalea sp.]
MTKLHFLLALLLLPVLINAQNITGTVRSAGTGQLLENVTIQDIKGKKSTISQPNGQFSLNLVPGNTVVFSYTGYVTKEVLSDSLLLNADVILSPAENSLDAVVITALGISKRKKSLGYATQELKYDDIAQAKETNIVNSLAGKWRVCASPTPREIWAPHEL